LTLGALELGAARWNPFIVDIVVCLTGRAGNSHEILGGENLATLAGVAVARAFVAEERLTEQGTSLKKEEG
jgi:hypothetical protein